MPRIVTLIRENPGRGRIKLSHETRCQDPSWAGGFTYVTPNPNGNRAERRAARRAGITSKEACTCEPVC